MRVAMDADQAVKEVQQLDGSLDKLKASGQQAATGLNATTAAADNTAKTGVKASVALAKLRAEADKAAASQKKVALTAGELRNAQRQLPAQITDIVTGLASGQSVFQVAIQQGGQLRDSFGGIRPALGAVAGAISPMVVGLVAGAAAFGAIGLAAFQGYQEIQGYERALIQTGNITGTTAGQVADMADKVGEATGQFKETEQAALQLASSGKIAAGNLENATRAAVALATLTGDSIESTTDKIIKLADAPSATLLQLNDQYHFLTTTVYEHVKSLEEQGRAEDAAREAVEFFANVHEQRVQEAEARAGSLERAWHSLGNTIAGIWNDLKDIGRTDAEYQVRVAQEALNNLQDPTRQAHGFGPSPEQLNQAREALRLAQERATQEQNAARVKAALQANEDYLLNAAGEREKKRKEAQQQWDRTELSNLTKKQRLEAEIEGIRKNGAALHKSDAEIDQQIAAARARYADSLPKGKKSSGGKSDAQQADEAAQREIENLTKQTAMLGLVAEGEQRVSEEARVRWEIENGAYRASSAANQAALIAAAKAKDAAQAAREEEEKRKKALEDTQRAYDRLRDQLRTPIETQIDQVTEDVKVLNAQLATGRITAEQYQQELGRVFKNAEIRAPEFHSPFEALNDPTGGIAQQSQLDQYAKLLEDWRANELAKQAAFRDQGLITEEQYNDRALAIDAQFAAQRAQLLTAQHEFQLLQVSSAFNSMAQIAKAFGGEQSKTYQALFALSKGFAVAQAVMAMWQSVAEAMKAGWPQNIPMIAAALAQGANIVSIIQGTNYSPQGYATGGRISGPGTRTSDSIPILASVDEHMIRASAATQPGARAFLDDFNLRGMAALRDWRGYAEGGRITAMPEPRARLQANAGGGTSVKNAMRVYLLNNEDELAQRLAAHPAMEKAVVAIAGENHLAITSKW